MDSQDLAMPIFHPLVATSSVFWHNWCCRGGDQARSVIRATTCTDSPRQSALIRTFQQNLHCLLLSNLCTYGMECPGPSKSSQAYSSISSKLER
jgi:hypothetical protein